MPGLQFRSGKSTLIPYVEIMLDQKVVGAERVPQDEYFINEVVVGPTPFPELTEEALRLLFREEKRPDVEIRQSKIPFRDW